MAASALFTLLLTPVSGAPPGLIWLSTLIIMGFAVVVVTPSAPIFAVNDETYTAKLVAMIRVMSMLQMIAASAVVLLAGGVMLVAAPMLAPWTLAVVLASTGLFLNSRSAGEFFTDRVEAIPIT